MTGFVNQLFGAQDQNRYVYHNTRLNQEKLLNEHRPLMRSDKG